MLRNLPAVLLFGMYAGPVARNFHAFASYCSISAMCISQLVFVASVARSFHAKEIWTDMF